MSVFIELSYHSSTACVPGVFKKIFVAISQIETIEPVPHTANVNAKVVLQSGTQLRVSQTPEQILKHITSAKDEHHG